MSIVEMLEAHSRDSKMCADLVEGLAYAGEAGISIARSDDAPAEKLFRVREYQQVIDRAAKS